MAVSLDGFLTRGSEADVTNWTSREDQKFFTDYLAKSKVLIMGKNTFFATPKSLKPKSSDRFSVVLTGKPSDYTEYSKSNVREFWDLSPKDVCNKLNSLGYSEATLLGGGKVFAEFLEAGLINEMFVTLEPQIFGVGTKAFNGSKLCDKKLRLVSQKQLNSKGTLLLKYEI